MNVCETCQAEGWVAWPNDHAAYLARVTCPECDGTGVAE